MVPSAFTSNGLAFPVGDRAGVLLKHMYMKMSLKVSRPAVSAISHRPEANSNMAKFRALNELAQAASTTQLVPPKFKRLAIRPAATLPSSPGNESSCHST